jgi:hypothetical protein
MPVSNPWVSYVTRSYQQIKASLIQGLTTKAPEVTDHSESNILIILISMFSGVAEMLGFYIDNTARESFILSARRYASMVKLTKLVDYRVKAANPATTDILITFSDPVPLTAGGLNYTLPTNIEVSDSNGVKFISQHYTPLSIPAGSTTMTISVIQQESVVNQTLGTSDGTTPNQSYPLPAGYVDRSMSLKIGGIPYTLVETFAYSFPQSTHYTVNVDESGVAFIILGDGSNGKIPAAASSLVASYQSTQGAVGNLPAETITTLITDLVPHLPVSTTAEVTNKLDATGGSAFENIEDIRKRAPLSVRTLLRAVTLKDYADVCILHPGVSKAKVDFECGKNIDVFIVPINGGIAQVGLLNDVGLWLDEYKMVGTFPIMRPAGVTNMVISMDVTLKFRADPVVATADIKAAVKEFFALKNQDINKAIYKSALQALVQTIESTEFMNIIKLTTLPYARIKYNETIAPLITTYELDWRPVILPASVAINRWLIVYKYDLVNYPAGKFIISLNGVYEGEVSPGVLYTSPSGNMTITAYAASLSTYVNNQAWEFSTYPYNQDHQLDDLTLPAVRLDATGEMPDVILNVIQTLTL